MERVVIKRSGTEEQFQTRKIVNAIFAILDGLTIPDDYEIVYKILKELDLKVPERVTTEELDYLVLKAIEQLIPLHPIYDTLATRQLLKIITLRLDRRFSSFTEYLQYGVKEELLKPELLTFDVAAIEKAIDGTRNRNLDYFGLTTLRDRYFTRDRDFEIIEKPQWFFMRVAMGIGNSEAEIVRIYDKLSKLEYLHSTPTLYNSGTTTSQYSSCYINVIDDSLESIMEKATETGFLAKYAGGVGSDVTRIRATGSKINSLNARSSGIIPFIKIFDTVVNAIQQGGRRRSSQVMYVQPWHYDIDSFLELKETTGNPYFRTPSLNTALWMPDEMMRRISAGEDIYLFDPAECPGLVDAWGDEFADLYEQYIHEAENGNLKLWRKVNGTEFFKRYLFKLAKTGHPWLTFKDAHNEHNPCPSYSVINSSNLCTEISIPNAPDSTAVCTLASVNLSRHLASDNSDIDWDKLRDTVETMVLALDNILDKNFYPSEASAKNTADLRPLGIGVMGLADALIDLGIPYDSDEAAGLARKIARFMRETAYASSEKLAAERGAFPHYEEMRMKGAAYDYPARRNAVLLAVAPTASISIIAGTSSSIDSIFSNIYSRDTLSGKFIVINRKLIAALEAAGRWNDETAERIKANGGSVQGIAEIAEAVDDALFKTAYEIDPKQQVDIAAAFQESVDQAVSKSLYIDDKFRGNMDEFYRYAWEKRLKSTYYCFIDKTVKGEKYTSSVNKRGSRRGFGAASGNGNGKKPETAEEPNGDLEKQAREKFGDEVVDKVLAGDVEGCPADPLLSKICPSCE